MNKAIGIFDSGLGGLTVFRELSQLLPNENIIYFGDTGRVPYGSKSKSTISKYAIQDINFLLSHGIKMVIAACGTVSSILSDLNMEFSFPITGVVLPTVYAAYHATKNKKIGVIGTSATIQSCSYKNYLTTLDNSIEVFQRDCPLFVPLVEEGLVSPDDPIVKLVIKKYLDDMKKNNIDTLILGCTHYPLLEEAIANEMGDKVTLINSGKETAIYVAQKLRDDGLLSDHKNNPKHKFYVSDRVNNFSKCARLFLKQDISNKVKQVDIEQY